MSHQEKQRIFDEYAKSQGYLSWDHIYVDNQIGLMSKDEFLIFMFDACDKVQEEQRKRIAENTKVIYLAEKKRNLSEQDRIIGAKIDKDSIINPENLIK